jgi:hypothetical protein
MHSLRIMVLALTLGSFAAAADAQTITSGIFQVYTNTTPPVAVGTQTTIPIGGAGFVCNQALPTGTPSTVNPTRIVADDPATPGKACIYTDPGTGPLASLPFGPTLYTGSLRWVNGSGINSPEAFDTIPPFSHPGQAAAAPTGLQVIR